MPCRDENGGFGELIRAVERSASPIILTEPRSPFRIVYVNESWTRTCGYSLQQTIGWTAAILQGPGTCKTTLALLGEAIRNGKSIRVELLNFTMHGRAFVNQLSISPIVDDSSGGIYLYKGVMRDKFEMLASPVGSMMLRPKRPPDIGFSSLLGAVAAPFFSRPSPLASGAAADAVGMRLTMTESVGAAIPWLGAPTAAAHARQDTCPQRRVPKFLTKLYALLSDKRFSHLASWSDDGLCICVHQPSVFAEVVLPCFYKHNRCALHLYRGLSHLERALLRSGPVWRDRARARTDLPRPHRAISISHAQV
jgi:PAS domain S-box-containing protein